MATLTVNPATPQNITNIVNEIVKNKILDPGNGEALSAKLANSQKQLEQKNNKAAVNTLQAFINQINAFIKTGKLTPEMGQQLINSANYAIAHIEGT
jgi:hypothetical protein